jgi:hypothetical protein
MITVTVDTDQLQLLTIIYTVYTFLCKRAITIEEKKYCTIHQALMLS